MANSLDLGGGGGAGFGALGEKNIKEIEKDFEYYDNCSGQVIST